MGTTKTQVCNGLRLADESFLPATLRSVRLCPARSDYIELCFETDEGIWTWCCPELAEPSEGGSGVGETVVITMGPYGPRARYLDDGRLGLAMPNPEATSMIVGGSRTYVARTLVKRGW